MNWDLPTVLGIVTGSTIFQALASIFVGRRKEKADSTSVLVRTALDQVTSLDKRYDALEKRYDALEDEVRTFRKQLAPHQQWDVKAYQKALESDPAFPAPPDLWI